MIGLSFHDSTHTELNQKIVGDARNATHARSINGRGTRARTSTKPSVMPDDRVRPRSTHVVFSTGCTTYFDWQAIGLAYSHYHSQQPGRDGGPTGPSPSVFVTNLKQHVV